MINGKASEYFLYANKYAYLTGSVSKESDGNGIAEFENLTIVGVNSYAIYIYFSLDNIVNKLWEKPISSLY